MKTGSGTDAGLNGLTGGRLGRAVTDELVRYQINGNVGVEGGKSSNKSCNCLDNVYVNCDVEVIADPCQEIIDTRTILCDKFEQTWTILAEILSRLP